MKDIIKSTILSSLCFSIGMTFFMVNYINADPIFVSLFSFFGFWILIFVFQLFMSKKNKELSKEVNEDIRYQGPANHFVGVESVGGHIFITKNKIIFKSHSYNIQNHNMEILLKDIVEVKKYNILGIIPTGLKIIQKLKTDTFVVNNRSKIVYILNKNK